MEKTLNRKDIAGATLIDFSKVFDTINHKLSLAEPHTSVLPLFMELAYCYFVYN